MEQTFKNADKDVIHTQTYAEEAPEARQPELSYSRAQEGNIAIEMLPREANFIETKCILAQHELEIIHKENDISESKHNPQEISSSEEISEDSSANTCDIICPENIMGMERGNCVPVTFMLSMQDTYGDTQGQCASEQDNECIDAVNDTKCARIPEEVRQTSVLVNKEVTLMPECGTEEQLVQLPGEVYQSVPLVNEEVALIPEYETEACQQVQLHGDVYQSAALVKNEVMFIPKCRTEAFQQVQLPGEDVQSSMSLCQNLQLQKKLVERCFTTVEEQGEVVMENKCVMPSVEVQQAEDVTRICADVASMPRPAISGCKPGWCGAMELVVLSSVGTEEEKLSFIESDNELEEDEDGSGNDIHEEVNDTNKRQRETSTVESNKQQEGISNEGELPTSATVVVEDNCDSISDNQQDCIDVSRYKKDGSSFSLVLGEYGEENEPASKRPRCSSEIKHDEYMMEPEIVCEGLQTSDKFVADDGSETLLQSLPAESASHWPALPNAPPCHQIHREDDNDGGSPPDDGESGQTYPNTCHEQISMSISNYDNQLVPEEYSRDHNHLVPDETFQDHRKTYSLYSDTRVGLNKSVSKISNSLEESLPSVHLTSLHFTDQVTPRSPVDTIHQACYPSCFEPRDAIASKLSQAQGNQ